MRTLGSSHLSKVALELETVPLTIPPKSPRLLAATKAAAHPCNQRASTVLHLMAHSLNFLITKLSLKINTFQTKTFPNTSVLTQRISQVQAPEI